MDKTKRTLITAGCVSIGSQFYINVLSDDYIIAIAVVIFGICLRIFPELNPLIVSLVTGICSPSFRCFVIWVNSNDWKYAAEVALPDSVFYFSFGILFYFIYYRRSKKDYTFFLVTLVLCDTVSNSAEWIFMNGISNTVPSAMETFFVAAMIRSVLVVAFCLTIDSYKQLLAKDEHELRYKKLMIMASVFNSEVYFMKKSIVEIEDVMKKAFSLYRTVEGGDYPKELQSLTLDIAKDVHEIKKGYLRVIKGLQDNFLLDIKITNLKLIDLVSILQTDIEELVKNRHKEIKFTTKIQNDFIVKDHYMLMSILRNLVVNAVDAVPNEETGLITLNVFEIVLMDEKFISFTIMDDGAGIKKEDMSIIFEPGYSTKFDENTGNINRGLGLTLVKNLVEERFGGKIVVESKEGVYTKFDVIIPVMYFEEN